MSIDPHQVTVIFRGLVDSRKCAKELFESITNLSRLGFSNVIVSTWNSLYLSTLNQAPCTVLVCDEGEFDWRNWETRQFARDNLRQIVHTTLRGLFEVRTPFAMILRSDIRVSKVADLTTWLDGEGPYFAIEGTRSPSKTLAPFFLSDFAFFMRTELALKAFQFCQRANRRMPYSSKSSLWANSQIRSGDNFWDNEQYIALSIIRSLNFEPTGVRLLDLFATADLIRSEQIGIKGLSSAGLSFPPRLDSKSSQMLPPVTRANRFLWKPRIRLKYFIGWLFDPYFYDSYRSRYRLFLRLMREK